MAHEHNHVRPQPRSRATRTASRPTPIIGSWRSRSALILGFMAVEVVAGIIADSLALLSDAAHMLTDAGALRLSLVVIRLAQRPARRRLTFGLAPHRDPLGAGQRRDAARARGPDRLRGDPTTDRRRPTRRRRRSSLSRSSASWSTWSRRGSSQGQPPVAQHRGLLPAHPHRPLRLHGHRRRRRRRSSPPASRAPTRSPRSSSPR